MQQDLTPVIDIIKFPLALVATLFGVYLIAVTIIWLLDVFNKKPSTPKKPYFTPEELRGELAAIEIEKMFERERNSK